MRNIPDGTHPSVRHPGRRTIWWPTPQAEPRCADTPDGAQPGGAHHGRRTQRAAHTTVCEHPGRPQPGVRTPRAAHNPVAHTLGGAQPGVRTPPAGYPPGVAQPCEVQPRERTFRRGPRSRPSLTGGVSARTEPHRCSAVFIYALMIIQSLIVGDMQRIR